MYGESTPTWKFQRQFKQNEVYMSSRTNEKGIGVWDFRGKEHNL